MRPTYFTNRRLHGDAMAAAKAARRANTGAADRAVAFCGAVLRAVVVGSRGELMVGEKGFITRVMM